MSVCKCVCRVARKAGCSYAGSTVADHNVKADQWPLIPSHYPEGLVSEEML